uniref:Uncharacterized protein n=1 Tax=Populus davidiana TaxID=266767 RepID=A0A6M2F068_9ROSI
MYNVVCALVVYCKPNMRIIKFKKSRRVCVCFGGGLGVCVLVVDDYSVLSYHGQLVIWHPKDCWTNIFILMQMQLYGTCLMCWCNTNLSMLSALAYLFMIYRIKMAACQAFCPYALQDIIR